MWNLFSAVEPKVLKPSRSLKQELLQQQVYSLKEIQKQARKMLCSINTILKSQACLTVQTKQQITLNNQIYELENTVNSLHKKVIQDNTTFQQFIQGRDKQKNNHQQFFRQTMKSYEYKKSQLNKYIEQIEERVQQLEFRGYKTYDIEPKPNNVINGINQNYIDKYISKLDEINKIQKGIHSIMKLNKPKPNVQVEEQTNNQTEIKQNKISLLSDSFKCNSLYDLQKQLELILLKQQILGQILDKKIYKCKVKFSKLATQQNLFKEALKKVGIAKQEKRKSTQKLSATCKNFIDKISTPLNSMKKTSSFFNCKNQKTQQRTQSLNPSFDQQIQKKSREAPQNEINQFDEELQVEQTSQVQDPEIPSQNFIQACEILITQRFLDEEDENHQDDR